VRARPYIRVRSVRVKARGCVASSRERFREGGRTCERTGDSTRFPPPPPLVPTPSPTCPPRRAFNYVPGLPLTSNFPNTAIIAVIMAWRAPSSSPALSVTVTPSLPLPLICRRRRRHRRGGVHARPRPPPSLRVALSPLLSPRYRVTSVPGIVILRGVTVSLSARLTVISHACVIS